MGFFSKIFDDLSEMSVEINMYKREYEDMSLEELKYEYERLCHRIRTTEVKRRLIAISNVVKARRNQ